MTSAARWSSLLFVSAVLGWSLPPLGCSATSENEIASGGNGAGNTGSASGGSGQGGLGIGQGGGNSGGNEACAAETYAGELVPLDLHVVLDRSASMQNDSKWGAVTAALQAFINDPSSAGVGIGLQYFPVSPTQPVPSACDGTNPNDPVCGLYGPCLPGFNICSGALAGGNDSCDPVDYQSPQLTIQALPGVAQTVTDSIAVHTPPSGDSTPSQPAMEGAAAYATQWAADNPTHLTVIVLATDGEPTGCSSNSVAGAASAAAGAFGASPSVLTFVVGVGTELGSLNQVAASGGTGQAFLVDTGANVTQQFIDAMNEIRATGQCQLQIPVPSGGATPDYGKVNVTIVDPDNPNTTIELFNVGSEAGCDPNEGGWYYDNPADPNVILLCPASCTQVTTTGWDVSVLLGCETIVK
jgi:hypothetical protein